MDATLSAALVEIDEGKARLAAIYAAWLDRETAAGRIAFQAPTQAMAETLAVSVKILKNRCLTQRQSMRISIGWLW